MHDLSAPRPPHQLFYLAMAVDRSSPDRASGIILFAMGWLPICACGYVKLWHGVVLIRKFRSISPMVHVVAYPPRLLFLWRNVADNAEGPWLGRLVVAMWSRAPGKWSRIPVGSSTAIAPARLRSTILATAS